jgi:peptidoglycan/LPS O-acetylase OafA/YrhL
MIHTGARTDLPQSPATELSSGPLSGSRNVRGLDSIRFWCALWVYFSHFGFLPLPPTWGLPREVLGLYNNLFCGVAAVIVFFVISGFCIHYPYAAVKKVPLGSFYVRRYIRILPPLFIALLLGKLLGQDMMGFYKDIIWSLIAELVYYTIYPALHLTLIRWPKQSLVLAYGTSFALIAAYPEALNFHQFGPGLTWLVGLPSWLLGCRLATKTVADGLRPTKSPWLWRGVVWAASSLASILRFHAHIGYPLTLTLFGILVYYWIRSEIRHYRVAQPSGFTEYCGRWSYSIYLVHGLAALGFASLGFTLNPAPLWIIQTIVVLVASFCFYLVVEMPSHRLARYWAGLARKQEARSAAGSMSRSQ